MDTARQFFVRELQDIYNAEKQVSRALSEIEQQCKRVEIKRAVVRHRKQTDGQIKRLDTVFRVIGTEPTERTCEGLAGLIQEKKSVEGERLSQDLIDLNALVSALKLKRYQVSAYEALIFLAQQLKRREAVRLLKENLKEEQDTAKVMLELLKKHKMDWTAGAEVPVKAAAPVARARRRAVVARGITAVAATRAARSRRPKAA